MRRGIGWAPADRDVPAAVLRQGQVGAIDRRADQVGHDQPARGHKTPRHGLSRPGVHLARSSSKGRRPRRKARRQRRNAGGGGRRELGAGAGARSAGESTCGGESASGPPAPAAIAAHEARLASARPAAAGDTAIIKHEQKAAAKQLPWRAAGQLSADQDERPVADLAEERMESPRHIAVRQLHCLGQSTQRCERLTAQQLGRRISGTGPALQAEEQALLNVALNAAQQAEQQAAGLGGARQRSGWCSRRLRGPWCRTRSPRRRRRWPAGSAATRPRSHLAARAVRTAGDWGH